MLRRRTAAISGLSAVAVVAAIAVTINGQSPTTDMPSTATLASAQISAAQVKAAPSSTVIAAKKSKVATTAKKISISVLPGISQPGRKAASATSAKSPINVQVSPKRRTKITLQVKSGKKWKKVANATTASNGRYTFKASTTSKGKAATYRVVAGSRKSASKSTAKWVKSTFTDNFSGSKLSSTWQHQRQDYNPNGNRHCSKGSPSASKVSGGAVRLSVIKDPARSGLCATTDKGKPKGKFAYRLNGNISTEGKFSFTYGVAAARMKFPRLMGQHGAFWMMPQTRAFETIDPKRTGAEIDVVESFGERYGKGKQGMTSFTYHWVWDNQAKKTTKLKKSGGWVPNPTSYLTKKSDNWWNAYHVFSVEWTPKEYIFRIDGKETWRSKAGVSGTDQYLALSLLSSDYEINLLKGGDKALPQHMNVDWVRVWETK